jgi:hypothetical protein
MKIILSLRRRHYVAIVSVFLVTAALIAGIASPYYLTLNLKIRTWYGLNAIRNNLGGHHILMNDLDSTTPGYEKLASPTANQGKGWDPIGFHVVTDDDVFSLPIDVIWYIYTGTFDGQRYEIRDLFINRPDEYNVGLFYILGDEGVIKDIGVVDATVTGKGGVGSLVGSNRGTVSNSYSTGTVTGFSQVGGLAGSNLGTVSNSYFTGNVAGTRYVGGLAGAIWGTMSNSYSSGTVTGMKWVGGLVGDSYRSTVSDSFWDTQTSGQATSDGGTGKNTTEMQDITTFSGAGWDIVLAPDPTHIWNIYDGVDYPFLSWQS